MTTILTPNQFGQVDLRRIEEFEQLNSIKLPSDYREFLIKNNGGRPTPNTLSIVETDVNYLFGIHDGPAWADLIRTIDTYEGRIPDWYMPIGVDSGGNLFIQSLYKENFGVIAFWDHERESKDDGREYFDNLTWLANSFKEFFNGLGSE
ncbi:MAG: SMI1/KNR4 family protein [Cytophagia bacterium]|nr:SMI1/KNR4 family protein [Cytophagia bacterium]